MRQQLSLRINIYFILLTVDVRYANHSSKTEGITPPISVVLAGVPAPIDGTRPAFPSRNRFTEDSYALPDGIGRALINHRRDNRARRLQKARAIIDR